MRETGSPEVPLSLAKALGGHLEMLLAVRGGGGRCAQSCAGLSFAKAWRVAIHGVAKSWTRLSN